MAKLLRRLITHRNLIILGSIILAIGILQAIFFGYAESLNPGLFFFENPMDKMTFGLILIGSSITTYLFGRKYRISSFNLEILPLAFTLFSRFFWEVLWVTGSYFPSMYISWATTNQCMPIFSWEGNAVLDYITEAWLHFTVQFSLFAISLAVLIFLLFSLYLDIKKKKSTRVR